MLNAIANAAAGLRTPMSAFLGTAFLANGKKRDRAWQPRTTWCATGPVLQKARQKQEIFAPLLHLRTQCLQSNQLYGFLGLSNIAFLSTAYRHRTAAPNTNGAFIWLLIDFVYKSITVQA